MTPPTEGAKDELLPCPFCGAVAKEPQNIGGKGRPVWELSCNIFCVAMRRSTRKELVMDWNTRRRQPEPQRDRAAQAGEHTPEPWRVDRFGAIVGGKIYGKGRVEWQEQVAMACGVSEENGNLNANARRIVACVNACAGIVTQTLINGGGSIGFYKMMADNANKLRQEAEQQNATLTADRAKLLGALKALCADLEAARKDAERFAWLCNEVDTDPYDKLVKTMHTEIVSGSVLRALIDVGIAEKGNSK